MKQFRILKAATGPLFLPLVGFGHYVISGAVDRYLKAFLESGRWSRFKYRLRTNLGRVSTFHSTQIFGSCVSTLNYSTIFLARSNYPWSWICGVLSVAGAAVMENCWLFFT